MPPLFTTSAVSRQVLGPRLPPSLRTISFTARPSSARIAPVTATASAPGAVPAQTRGYAFGQKGGDQGEDRTHVTDKESTDSKYNIHSSASKSGFADKNTANGEDTHTGHSRSQAATQKDQHKSGEKAKEEHPEAPEPIIGMSDERGGRGH